jgi:FtsZ-binding cell division protein ZapB
MDKLHKYAQKYCDGEIVISTLGNSYYYHFNNGKFVLRISDHIGRNSDGKVSIIIDKNGYLLHNHSTGAVYIETYENIKAFIRSLAVFSEVNVKMETSNKSEIGELKNETNSLKQKIESLSKKNEKLGENNTRLNNENVAYKSQVKSMKKENESLREQMRRFPIRTWFKLFFRYQKAKK